MSDPRPTLPETPRADGGDRRRLDRAPAERYRDGSGGGGAARRGAASGGGPGGAARRALVAAILVADVGALLFFALGQLDLGIGLLAVAAFTGWATALAVIWWGRDALPATSTRVAVGAILGAWSVAGGILLDWVASLLQHGVLGPLEYVDQRYGPVAWVSILVAAGVAALRAR